MGTNIRIFMVGAALLAIAACNRGGPEDPEPTPSASPSATGTASILRPDVEAESDIPRAIEPAILTLAFADSGDELSDDAAARLDELLEGPQLAEGWPITIGGHSDAGGDGDANMRMSQARADAVAAYLVGKGIAEDRITVIAFGEQNPIAPNALPGGEPNEEGRAQNRRVDVVVAESGGLAVMESEPEPTPSATPTETLSETISKAVTPSN